MTILKKYQKIKAEYNKAKKLALSINNDNPNSINDIEKIFNITERDLLDLDNSDKTKLNNTEVKDITEILQEISKLHKEISEILLAKKTNLKKLLQEKQNQSNGIKEYGNKDKPIAKFHNKKH